MDAGTSPNRARVFVSAGEASGDAYGAALARALGDGFALEAVGGRRLAEGGARMVAASSHWGAIGIAESVRVGPRVMRGFLAAASRLRQGASGLFVPIDFGFFNVPLARRAKRRGWRVLYFAPPGSWRRDRQGRDLPGVADAIVTPFSWSAELLRGMGADARWFGHPLRELIANAGDAPERGDAIAVLPGSRTHEIEHNLAAVARGIARLANPVEIALAPSVSADAVGRMWNRAAGGRPATLRERGTYDVLQRARAAVVCSGTATLEAALCGCPSVVVYRGSRMMALEFAIRRPHFEHVALPNILLQRRLLPELLGGEASPEAIGHALSPLLAGGSEREAQLDGFAELDGMLGPSDAITRTAELMRSMLANAS